MDENGTRLEIVKSVGEVANGVEQIAYGYPGHAAGVCLHMQSPVPYIAIYAVIRDAAVPPTPFSMDLCYPMSMQTVCTRKIACNKD